MRGIEACALMRRGEYVRRAGWKPSARIGLHTPPPGGRLTLPYTYMIIGHDRGDRFPWMGSEEDLLADDWETATYRGDDK